ncbi:hypothetical protein EAI_14738 [Harpegnathos saltator]|uniref:Uncharacterized protein n=1 Tax=Harpegnathos saltator TaxID=610380 RepID=E2BV97_HARSA|nr:hypothetical protein EAI_14738 [Harpegnathos saltator]
MPPHLQFASSLLYITVEGHGPVLPKTVVGPQGDKVCVANGLQPFWRRGIGSGVVSEGFSMSFLKHQIGKNGNKYRFVALREHKVLVCSIKRALHPIRLSNLMKMKKLRFDIQFLHLVNFNQEFHNTDKCFFRNPISSMKLLKKERVSKDFVEILTSSNAARPAVLPLRRHLLNPGMPSALVLAECGMETRRREDEGRGGAARTVQPPPPPPPPPPPSLLPASYPNLSAEFIELEVSVENLELRHYAGSYPLMFEITTYLFCAYKRSNGTKSHLVDDLPIHHFIFKVVKKSGLGLLPETKCPVILTFGFGNPRKTSPAVESSERRVNHPTHRHDEREEKEKEEKEETVVSV